MTKTKGPLQPIKNGIHYSRVIVDNFVDHSLRRFFKPEHGPWTPKNESKSRADLFAYLPLKEQEEASALAKELRTRFALDRLWVTSSIKNYRKNLFYMDVLNRALTLATPDLPNSIDAVDVVARDWAHVAGLRALLTKWNCPEGREVRLCGFEADPYQPCRDQFPRQAHAEGYARGLEDVQYIPHGFAPRSHTFDVAIMLFPNVFLKTHLDEGLPLNQFRPRALARNIRPSLRPGGVLLVVNRDEREHRRQQAMLAAADLEPLVAFSHRSLFRKDLPTVQVLVAALEKDEE